MFRYVSVIMIWLALPLLASPDVPPSNDMSSTEDLSQEDNISPSPVEEENDEPSLEEPNPGESTAFEVGTPPVTEESLEEEDSAE
jgi:hypothetical protein